MCVTVHQELETVIICPKGESSEFYNVPKIVGFPGKCPQLTLAPLATFPGL